jgi:hypothetical protein
MAETGDVEFESSNPMAAAGLQPLPTRRWSLRMGLTLWASWGAVAAR